MLTSGCQANVYLHICACDCTLINTIVAKMSNIYWNFFLIPNINSPSRIIFIMRNGWFTQSEKILQCKLWVSMGRSLGSLVSETIWSVHCSQQLVVICHFCLSTLVTARALDSADQLWTWKHAAPPQPEESFPIVSTEALSWQNQVIWWSPRQRMNKRMA